MAKLGRSEKLIQLRMTGKETRNKLTYYWKESGEEKSDGTSEAVNNTSWTLTTLGTVLKLNTTAIIASNTRSRIAFKVIANVLGTKANFHRQYQSKCKWG